MVSILRKIGLALLLGPIFCGAQILPVANGGTGTSSPSLVGGANVTITGSWPNQTVSSSAAGGGNTLSAYGTLVNQTSWSSGTGWTSNGTTPSISGGALHFSGGAGTFTQSYDWIGTGASPYNTNLPIWSIQASITPGTPNSTSFGMGVGIRSTASAQTFSAICRMDMTNVGGNTGILYINLLSGTQAAASSAAVTWSAGDNVNIIFSRNYSGLTCTAVDTTTSSSQTVSYTISYAPGATLYQPNIGHFALYNFGGSHTVTAFSVSSQALTGTQLAYVGDSKTAGYFQSSSAFSNQCATPQTSVTLAGGSETTTDILAALPEVLALGPKNVILDIGRNNFCSPGAGTVVAAETDYANIAQQLTAAGINVWNLQTWETTCASQATFYTWMNSNYSSWSSGGHGTSFLVNPNLQQYGAAAVLASDNIHPNAQGAIYVTNALNAALTANSGTNQYLFACKQ